MVVLVVAVVAVAAGFIWVAVTGLGRAMENRLSVTDAELRRLADANASRQDGTVEIRQEVAAFGRLLETMQAREIERRSREEEGWAVLHRVAAVLSGAQRTGQAGENVLREAFAHLPPSMLDTNFRVNGRVVEFGVVLPDGRRLPVDSKWSAERELVLLAEGVPDADRERLVRSIERAVVERSKEVAGYLDPALTSSVAVAAIPDAAYGVLRRAHADAYRHGVLVIPYSMALPVVLFLHSLMARFGAVRDVDACLADLASTLHSVETTLENSIVKATRMLQNGTDQIRSDVGKARTTLSHARQREEVEVESAPLRVVGAEP
ncbi:MAG TPA: DNA recombination protein RmuC [Actinomycetota bacterium]|jgi:hypothetical protein